MLELLDSGGEVVESQKYQEVTDLAFVAASHFNRLIILLLDTMPEQSPILEEQELGLRHEITFNPDIYPCT